MTEFGQCYRVCKWTQEACTKCLKDLGLGQTYDLGEGEGYLQLSLWNLDIDDLLRQKLAASQLDFLTYIYHTGAGYDELTLYTQGQQTLLEDLGERYRFECGDISVPLEYNFEYQPTYDDQPLDAFYDDSFGWSNKLIHNPTRTAALTELVDTINPNLIPNLQKLIKEDWPLYYATDLVT